MTSVTDLHWWMPIPWVIGLAAIVIAIVAFRRSRYPRIRFRIVSGGYIQRYPGSTYHAHLFADAISVGSDIFDLQAYLEVDTLCWVRKRRSKWAPRYPMPTTAKFPLKPVKPLPDPVKNGQAVRFELTDHDIQSIALSHRYWKLPSLRWPGHVRIAFYSGDRRLSIRKSWWWRGSLRAFDSGSLEALELEGEQPQNQPDSRSNAGDV